MPHRDRLMFCFPKDCEKSFTSTDSSALSRRKALDFSVVDLGGNRLDKA